MMQRYNNGDWPKAVLLKHIVAITERPIVWKSWTAKFSSLAPVPSAWELDFSALSISVARNNTTTTLPQINHKSPSLPAALILIVADLPFCRCSCHAICPAYLSFSFCCRKNVWLALNEDYKLLLLTTGVVPARLQDNVHERALPHFTFKFARCKLKI